MDYFSSDTWVDPEKGDLLISEPYLPDPNFERTVVLLCEHDENGTFGFVLNKRTQSQFKDVVEDVNHFDADLFVGGPVQQNSLHFIHKREDQIEGSREILPGMYWGGDFDQLLTLIDTRQLNKEDFRFFVGYSGWEPGQLKSELEVKSWIIHKKATPQMIFEHDADQLWSEVLKTMGGKFRVIANYPQDPRLN